MTFGWCKVSVQAPGSGEVMASSAASIADLAGLLAIAAPRKFKALRAEPYTGILLGEGGATLGDEDKTDAGGPAEDQRRAAEVKIAVECLKIVDRVLEPAVNRVRNQLVMAHRIEFGGEILGALGSGTAIATLLGKPGPEGTTATIVAATIGLVGTLAALTVKFLRRDVLGAENATARQYSDLRAAAWDSRIFLARLQPLLDQPALIKGDTGLVAVIEQANKLARRVYDTLKDLGVDVSLSTA